MDEPKIIPKKIALFLLLVFIIIGGYLRLSNLSRYSFWIDEFYHVFSAKGILDTGKPILPSGILYTRAIIYTYIVSIFFKFFGVSEVTARLPSAIFGILMIPLTYYVVSRFLNRNIGIISAFLIAFSPFCIAWAKVCRMYTLFQLLYFLSVLYFLKAFEERENKDRTIFSYSNIKNYLLFFFIYFLSISIQDLSISFIPTLLVYGIVMLFFSCLMKGFNSALHSKYFKMSLLIVLAGLGGIFLNSVFWKRDLLISLQKFPTWAQENAFNIHYYRLFLQKANTVFYYLYPIALLTLILRRPKLGFYLSCCFLIPFLALSFIFKWKDERYMFFIFPFFLIAVSSVIELILSDTWHFFNVKSKDLLSKSIIRNKTIAGFIICSIAMIFISFPIFWSWIRKNPDNYTFERFGVGNFKKFAEFIDTIDKIDIIICTEPLLIKYYSNRNPDYAFKINEFKGRFNDSKELMNKEGKEIDFGGGIPVINSLYDLKILEGTQKKIWIVTNKYVLEPTLIDRDLQNYVKQNYKKYPISEKEYEIYYK